MLKKSILLSLLITLIIWLFFQAQDKTNKTVSLISQQKINIEKNTTHKETKSPKIKQAKLETVTNKSIIKEKTNKLTQYNYLELYQKSLVAKDCLGFYIQGRNTRFTNDGKNNSDEIDYIKSYNDNITYNSNGRQKEATPSQIEFYQTYVDECKSLKNEIEDSANTNDLKKQKEVFTYNFIRTTMLKTKAITDKEKQIKTTLKLSKSYTNTLSKLSALIKKNKKLSEQELNIIEQRLESLNNIMNSGEFSTQDSQLSSEFTNLKQEIDELNSTIKPKTASDKQLFETTKQQLININNNLKSQLHTQYPSVFIETFRAFNINSRWFNVLPDIYLQQRFEKSGFKISTISQQIQKQTQIKNDDYFNQLLQPAIDLYLCYLGGDCNNANNRTLAYYCFMPRVGYLETISGLYFEACEMNLEDFYLQNFLTENQVDDMTELFNYFVQNYAK